MPDTAVVGSTYGPAEVDRSKDRPKNPFPAPWVVPGGGSSPADPYTTPEGDPNKSAMPALLERLGALDGRHDFNQLWVNLPGLKLPRNRPEAQGDTMLPLGPFRKSGEDLFA